MKKNELTEAIESVATQRNIPLEDVVTAIEKGVADSANRILRRYDIKARFDLDSGEFSLYEQFCVEGDDASDGDYETGAAGEGDAFDQIDDEDEDLTLKLISLARARRIDPNLNAGDTFEREVKLEGLKRIASQTVRKEIFRRSKRADRETTRKSGESRHGEMISGDFVEKDKKGFIFLTQEGRAFMPAIEKLAGDRYDLGKTFRLAITGSADEDEKEYLLTVSRLAPALLENLMKRESPELRDGLITIIKTVRDPDGFAKVAVKSMDDRIDPVGSLIGVGGARIKSVQRELAGEKIDIVRHTEDKAEFIRNVMTPAKGVEVLMSEDGRTADVIVPDDFLTSAIGKRGVNVRLASKLAGAELDVMSKKEYEDKLARNAGGRDDTLLGDQS